MRTFWLIVFINVAIFLLVCEALSGRVRSHMSDASKSWGSREEKFEDFKGLSKDGLQIRVVAENSKAKQKDLSLTCIVKNVSNQPISIYEGDESWSLSIFFHDSRKSYWDWEPKFSVADCPTGVIWKTLSPGDEWSTKISNLNAFCSSYFDNLDSGKYWIGARWARPVEDSIKGTYHDIDYFSSPIEIEILQSFDIGKSLRKNYFKYREIIGFLKANREFYQLKYWFMFILFNLGIFLLIRKISRTPSQ